MEFNGNVIDIKDGSCPSCHANVNKIEREVRILDTRDERGRSIFEERWVCQDCGRRSAWSKNDMETLYQFYSLDDSFRFDASCSIKKDRKMVTIPLSVACHCLERVELFNSAMDRVVAEYLATAIDASGVGR